ANHVIRTARVLFSYAKFKGFIPENPFKGWRLIGVEVEDVWWTRGEVEAFIKAADSLGYPSIGTAAMLAFELCQRQADIRHLAWVQYDGESIQIRQEKTGVRIKISLVPNIPNLKARLDLSPRRGALIVMQDRPDKRKKVFLPYGKNTFAHHVRLVREAAGLSPKLKFMHLRHSGATELGDAGATEPEIMSITGHKTHEAVARYIKPTRRQARHGIAKRQALRTKMGQKSE
ncbi:MAG: tyrosine-type recombinase/integrase, partial [Alphaproteobacteria bacterium]|nr:tyrosine-type recombinase/integrase [Alphaproteobacteria bacterium]